MIEPMGQAIKYVRTHCNMLLLDAKRAVESHVAAHHCSYAEAAAAVVQAHRDMYDIEAECKRIAAERAVEALRVTAGYTTAELRAMPDQALGLVLRRVSLPNTPVAEPAPLEETQAVDTPLFSVVEYVNGYASLLASHAAVVAALDKRCAILEKIRAAAQRPSTFHAEWLRITLEDEKP